MVERQARRRGPSITRTKTRRKPPLLRQALDWYQAEDGQMLVSMLGPAAGLTPVAVQPADDAHALTYQIYGGLDRNAIKVDVSAIADEHHLQWIALMTFTGMQYKRVTPGKTEYIFALADEDAYAYCGKDPCEECVFKCKNGFMLYLACQEDGIFGTVVSSRLRINNQL